MTNFRDRISETSESVQDWVENHAKAIRAVLIAVTTATAAGAQMINNDQLKEVSSLMGDSAFMMHDSLRYQAFTIPAQELTTELRSDYMRYYNLLRGTYNHLQAIKNSSVLQHAMTVNGAETTFAHFIESSLRTAEEGIDLMTRVLEEGRVLTDEELGQVRGISMFLARETESFVYDQIWFEWSANQNFRDKENMITMLSLLVALVTALTGIKINLFPASRRHAEKSKNGKGEAFERLTPEDIERYARPEGAEEPLTVADLLAMAKEEKLKHKGDREG